MPKGRSRHRSRQSAKYERTGRQSRAYKSKSRYPRKSPSAPKGPSRGYINRRSDAWRKATGSAIRRAGR